MPPRLVCLAILLYWVVAASSLIRRDILPELRFARPPDLLAIARAVRDGGPVAVERPGDRRPAHSRDPPHRSARPSPSRSAGPTAASG